MDLCYDILSEFDLSIEDRYEFMMINELSFELRFEDKDLRVEEYYRYVIDTLLIDDQIPECARSFIIRVLNSRNEEFVRWMCKCKEDLFDDITIRHLYFTGNLEMLKVLYEGGIKGVLSNDGGLVGITGDMYGEFENWLREKRRDSGMVVGDEYRWTDRIGDWENGQNRASNLGTVQYGFGVDGMGCGLPQSHEIGKSVNKYRSLSEFMTKHGSYTLDSFYRAGNDVEEFIESIREVITLSIGS